MKVLVCPLDWGLGHATRDIPLIRALLGNGHQVMIGATGGGRRLLEAEFPELDIFDFPGYQVRYSRSPALFLPVMLMQMPGLIAGLFRERAGLRRILAKRAPDLVISDGRYGVFTRAVPCIFITHQVFIRVPGRFPGITLLERLVLAINLPLLRRFEQIWVPDFPGPKTLSGDLSHKPCPLRNLVFIHPLSRFGAEDGTPGAGALPRVDILALASGPEPQRGIFEAALRRQLQGMKGTRVLVRGLPEAHSRNGRPPFALRAGQLNEFSHLPGETLTLLLGGAALVVARSGYTTVMEMAGLGIRAAMLVPTPGQSEQEYLADHLESSATAMRVDQQGMDLDRARQSIGRYTGFSAWTRNAFSGNDAAAPAFSLHEFIRTHPLFQAASGSGSSAADEGP